MRQTLMVGLVVVLTAISGSVHAQGLARLAQTGEPQIVMHSGIDGPAMLIGSAAGEAYVGIERMLMNKGLQPDWNAAFTGEGTERNGSAKMMLVPFIAADTRKVTWVVAIAREASGVEETEVKVLQTEADGERLVAAENTKTGVRAALWKDIQYIIGAIIHGDIRYAIFRIGYLLRRGVVDWVLAPQIKSELESRGYRCVEPRWYVPFKSIWYAATCARPVM